MVESAHYIEGTIHLSQWQILCDFDPSSPPPIGKFDQCLTPHPIKNANILNGYSLSWLKSNNQMENSIRVIRKLC